VAYVLVPYNMAIPIQVTGGGAFTEATLQGQQNPVVLSLAAAPTSMMVGTSTVYQVTATTRIGGQLVGGVGVSFSVLSQTNTTALTIAPSSTATDTNGTAVAYVAVAPGNHVAIEAIVSGVNAGQTVIIDG